MIQQQIQIHKGVITIELKGLDIKTVERYRKNIHQLMIKGVFEVQAGKVILHFDKDKVMRKVEIQIVAWQS